MVEKILDNLCCMFGWHIPIQEDKSKGYTDGIGRHHTNCKNCYSHMPQNTCVILERHIFGKWRRKTLLICLGKLIRYN